MRPRYTLLVAAMSAVAGCQSVDIPPEIWSKAPPEPTVEMPVQVAGVVAGIALPLSTRLFGDTRPVELSAFEVPPEERAKFQKERSEWVSQQASKETRNFYKSSNCGSLTRCAVVLGLVGVTLLPVYTINLGLASASNDGPQLIPAKEGAAVSQLFRQEATGFALTERIGRLNGSRGAAEGDDEYPQLVVRVRSARLISYGPALRVSITASAQPLRFRDEPGAASEHTADFVIERSREGLIKSVDAAMQVLARNISATYFPEGREALWAKVRDTQDPGELRRYIAGDPRGPYAKEAEVRIAALYHRDCRQSSPPLAVPLELSAGAQLPRAGDSFTYRVGGGPTTWTYRVKSATRQYIVEEYKTSDWCTRDWHHTGGAYIAEQGTAVFSPYLGITTDLKWTQADWQLPAYTCRDGICNSRIRVVGVETVEVPAGRFEATKVQVDHSWGRGGLFRRSMTIWYVPAVRRAVKFSSTSGPDLELVSYELK